MNSTLKCPLCFLEQDTRNQECGSTQCANAEKDMFRNWEGEMRFIGHFAARYEQIALDFLPRTIECHTFRILPSLFRGSIPPSAGPQSSAPLVASTATKNAAEGIGTATRSRLHHDPPRARGKGIDSDEAFVATNPPRGNRRTAQNQLPPLGLSSTLPPSALPRIPSPLGLTRQDDDRRRSRSPQGTRAETPGRGNSGRAHRTQPGRRYARREAEASSQTLSPERLSRELENNRLCAELGRAIRDRDRYGRERDVFRAQLTNLAKNHRETMQKEQASFNQKLTDLSSALKKAEEDRDEQKAKLEELRKAQKRNKAKRDEIPDHVAHMYM